MQRYFLSQPELRGPFQLGALGFPQTDGACWMPPGSISAPQGGWVKTNDPLAECTYQGPTAPNTPATPTTTTTSTGWAAIPTWIKLAGGAVLAFAGYKLFIQGRQKRL